MVRTKFKLSILFVFLFILCLTFNVQAKEISIGNLDVNAELFKDGSLNVEENIEFKVEGEFNGLYRAIEIKEASNIEDINVSQITNSGKKEFKRVDKAKNGEKDVYELIKKDNIYTLKLYSPSKNENKNFKITYKLIGAAVKYNDAGMLYYRFGGEKSETKVDKFNINLSIPDGSENKNLKILINKPLYNSESSILDNNKFNVKGEKVEEKIPIEIRAVFPAKIILLSSNVKNQDILPQIIEEENKIKESLEYEKNKKELIKKVGNFTNPVFIIINIAIGLFIYKKKNRKRDNLNLEFFPEECTPAVASKLYSKNIRQKDLVASILDLVRKGYLTFKKEDKDKYTIMKNKNIDEYILRHEEFLINWFIRKIGDGLKVTSCEIESYSNKSSKEFLEEFNAWKYSVGQDFDEKNYFDKSAASFGKKFIMLSVFQLAATIVFLFYGSIISVVNIIASLFIIIYSIPLFARKNDYGYNQTLKWKEFKKYMENDAYIKEKVFESNKDIDKYLVYAIALGVNERAIEKMNIQFKDSDKYYDDSCMYWYYALNMDDDDNVIQNSIQYSQDSTSSSDSSSFSSDCGGGCGGDGAGGF